MLRLNWTHEQTWYVSCGCVVPAMACMASSHSTQHPAPSTPRSPLSIERWASLSTAQKIFQFPNLNSQKPERAARKVEWLLTALGGQHESNRIESSSANQSTSQIGRKLVNGTNQHKAAQPRAQQTLHSNGATTEGATAVPHRECFCSTYKRRHQIDNKQQPLYTLIIMLTRQNGQYTRDISSNCIDNELRRLTTLSALAPNTNYRHLCL